MQRLGLIICLVMVFFAFINKAKKDVIYSDKAPKPIGPYSQAIKSGGTLYVSGQIALNPKGELDTTNIENECKQVMENIKHIIEAAGMKMDNIVKSSVFCTNLNNFSKINEVYGNYFNKQPPARETIQVVALPKGAHLEISVIAEE